jgi:hypothetical protein
MCASQLGPSGEETPEFDGCRQDALAMPPWHFDVATLSAATTCFAAAVSVAAMRHARGAPTRRRALPAGRSRATKRAR